MAGVVLLYRNDFKQIDFTAANFTPKGDLNPCTDIEGLKAKVQYAEVSDKSVAGQIISVELLNSRRFHRHSYLKTALNVEVRSHRVHHNFT